jgi:hypothetical protein
MERDTSHTTSHTSFTQPYPPSYTHAHTPQVELSQSPAVAAWLMDVARGRWSGESPLPLKQSAYMAACQIALAEPLGDSSVARAVTDALWRAMMVHGSSPAAAVSGLQVLARTAAAGGLEDRDREEDVGEEDAEEAGHGALSHPREGGSDERREDAVDKRPVRALRALLHHHESCPEVVKLCAR